jgi:DNA-binding response OmpR family regulator
MRQIIMIVDDEGDILDILTQLLESEGFVVVAFGDSRAAFEYARLQPPDLALVDLLMPNMDGRELIRRLRADHSGDFPIIVMSASMNFEQVRDLPIQDYVSKPFDLDDVLLHVRRALRAYAPVHGEKVAD